MKKLIVAISAITVAVAANATAIAWNSGTVTDINKQTIGSKTADAGWSAAVTFWDATGANVISTVNTVDNTAAMSKFGLTTGDDFASMTSYMGQLVITDASGNSITSEKALFTTDGALTYQLNFGSGNGFPGQKSQIDYTKGWSGNVPEPTSGLLVLLGFAGLALRRRRA